MPLRRFLFILALVMIMAGLTVAAAFAADFLFAESFPVIPSSGLLAAVMGLALIARFGTGRR